MLRRYRGFILAIGLAVFLVSGLAWTLIDTTRSKQIGYEQSAKYNSDNYAKRRHVIIRDRCGSLAVSEKAACVNEERDTARKGQHDERDLEAQRVTAAWTAAMGIAAIVGMGASLVGVLLVFITFQETRTANKIAREVGEAQTSAYLITPIFAPAVVVRDGDLFVITIENIGNSMAAAILFTGGVKVEVQGRLFDLPFTTESFIRKHIAANDKATFHARTDEALVEEIFALITAENWPEFSGNFEMSYRDVFGNNVADTGQVEGKFYINMNGPDYRSLGTGVTIMQNTLKRVVHRTKQ